MRLINKEFASIRNRLPSPLALSGADLRELPDICPQNNPQDGRVSAISFSSNELEDILNVGSTIVRQASKEA
jgi:hypothetical protein